MWSLLAALGYFCGAMLAVLAKEEVRASKKYLLALSRILFLALLAIAVHPIVLILLFLPLRWEEPIIYAALSGMFVGLYATPLIVSLSFLLGFPLGSIDKRLFFVFLLVSLPWNIDCSLFSC